MLSEGDSELSKKEDTPAGHLEDSRTLRRVILLHEPTLPTAAAIAIAGKGTAAKGLF